MKSFRLLIVILLISFGFLLVSCGSDDDDDDSGNAPTDDDDNDNDDNDDNNDDNDDNDNDDNDDNDDTTPEWLTIPAGQMSVHIRLNPYYLEILGPDSQTLLATNEPEKALNLSPMPFLPHGFQAGNFGDNWYYAAEVLDWSQDGDTWTVNVRAVNTQERNREAGLTLIFEKAADNHLVFSTTATGVEEVKYYSGGYRLDADEHFFGLGLQYDDIDQRGKIRTMFVGLGVDLTDQIQNHAPMPFYFSSRGYGLFVEDKGRGYFDMGYTRDDAYGYKYYTDRLTTHVFWGPAPLDIIENYTGVTGRPPMNPDYLFGHLHWRNVNNSESEVYADADALREHGIPTSSIMVDAPWQTSYSTFVFNECPSGCQFSDAQAVIDYVHDQGYAFYLWTAEFVNRVSPVEVPGMIEDNSAQFNFAKDNGYLVSILGLLYEYPWWHDNGAMVNFLNPNAYTWYQDLVRNVMNMGVQGFKMDGGEYIGADTLGLWPANAFNLGDFGDAMTEQYEYKWAYHQLFWELAQEYNGGLGVCTVRTAVWGEQTHINYFWPGDMESDWSFALGLPADIIGGLTLGTAGFPYYGSNDGGFASYDADDPQLLMRWTAHSAFRPIFESPKNGAQEVWEHYAAPMEDVYRRYAVIHTRLFPYMKAYAREATLTGHPIMRMLPLVYLDDTITYDRNWDYLLGDWLLVEPVYLHDQFERDIYLPADRWVDYWTNEVYDGPDNFTRDVPQEDIPVYAKAGAIIPLLDPSVETLWPTDNPEVIDHTDVADLLWVELYPYGNSSFTLEDDTAFALAQSGGGFTLTVSGAPLARTYSLRAVPATYDGGAPSTVTGPAGALTEYASYVEWDAAASGWFYDSTAGNLWIRDTFLAGTVTVD
ncbi:MAG: glycoside hydrolase family 31 protein [Myxococcales bacterium]|nr:glycoside hydrolase family 31 protein [Myxococcales bacterium]